jgi:hypothetical protein
MFCIRCVGFGRFFEKKAPFFLHFGAHRVEARLTALGERVVLLLEHVKRGRRELLSAALATPALRVPSSPQRVDGARADALHACRANLGQIRVSAFLRRVGHDVSLVFRCLRCASATLERVLGESKLVGPDFCCCCCCVSGGTTSAGKTVATNERRGERANGGSAAPNCPFQKGAGNSSLSERGRDKAAKALDKRLLSLTSAETKRQTHKINRESGGDKTLAQHILFFPQSAHVIHLLWTQLAPFWADTHCPVAL